MSWMCGGVSLQDSGTVERTGQGQGSVEVRAAFYAIEVGHRHAGVMQGTWVTAKGGCRPAGRDACIGLKCPCRFLHCRRTGVVFTELSSQSLRESCSKAPTSGRDYRTRGKINKATQQSLATNKKEVLRTKPQDHRLTVRAPGSRRVGPAEAGWRCGIGGGGPLASARHNGACFQASHSGSVDLRSSPAR